MNTDHDNKRLFHEFPPVPTADWEAKINDDLKGADYNTKLVWKTLEGFSVKPYYRSEDLLKLGYISSLPGEYPFVRGNKTTDNSWLIRQDIYVDDIKKANAKVLDIVTKGVKSVGFIMNPQFEPTLAEIEELLQQINAENVELNFILQRNSLNVAGYFVDLARKYNRDLSRIHGSVDFDPLGTFTLKGRFPKSASDSFDHCKEIIDMSVLLPNYRVITVNAKHFHNAGATAIQELAFGLSIGTNYLTQLTERNLSINDIAPKMKFNFSIGSNYFMEIAKLRAARYLWSQIVKAYGTFNLDVPKMYIHAETSLWNKTIYDPYVNILRSSTEAMSAIIGGVDSLQVHPLDLVNYKDNEFADRIARNQQLLLKEEAYLDRVIDPAAGSYYIENLTDYLIEHSWNLYLQVQEIGSYLEAFKAGFIQASIKETAALRNSNVATRKEIFLGTNQFPNPNEKLDDPVDIALLEPTDRTEEGAFTSTIKTYRAAQGFEKLRMKTDIWSKSNKRPVVFMLTLGNISMRRARAEFAGNFFACAGFAIHDNLGFSSAQEGINAALEVKPEIVVICSSDDEYALLVPEIFEKLKDHSLVVLAGYPKNLVEQFTALGLNRFIHVRSNVLETLKTLQQELGIL